MIRSIKNTGDVSHADAIEYSLTLWLKDLESLKLDIPARPIDLIPALEKHYSTHTHTQIILLAIGETAQGHLIKIFSPI